MDHFPTDRDLARLDTAAYSPPKADFSRSISILQTPNDLLKPLAIFFFSYALVGSLVRKRPSHGRMSTASIMSATKVAGAVRTWEQYRGEAVRECVISRVEALDGAKPWPLGLPKYGLCLRGLGPRSGKAVDKSAR